MITTQALSDGDRGARISDIGKNLNQKFNQSLIQNEKRKAAKERTRDLH
jgi:hypothetical protein